MASSAIFHVFMTFQTRIAQEKRAHSSPPTRPLAGDTPGAWNWKGTRACHTTPDAVYHASKIISDFQRVLKTPKNHFFRQSLMTTHASRRALSDEFNLRALRPIPIEFTLERKLTAFCALRANQSWTPGCWSIYVGECRVRTRWLNRVVV